MLESIMLHAQILLVITPRTAQQYAKLKDKERERQKRNRQTDKLAHRFLPKRHNTWPHIFIITGSSFKGQIDTQKDRQTVGQRHNKTDRERQTE